MEFKKEVKLGKNEVKKCLDRLSERLINEKGMTNIGTAIWRLDKSQDLMIKQTVGEFLSQPENQSGDWYIDGGWGGPPGPVMVHWDPLFKQWISFGFPPWEENVERWNRIREDVWNKQK
jgi:hypothetical protein